MPRVDLRSLRYHRNSYTTKRSGASVAVHLHAGSVRARSLVYLETVCGCNLHSNGPSAPSAPQVEVTTTTASTTLIIHVEEFLLQGVKPYDIDKSP